MKKFNRRFLPWIGLAIAIALILAILNAPGGGGVDRGSSYGRSPGGYGAWYAYMEKRSAPIGRWRKDFARLAERPELSTLIRVYPQLTADEVDRDMFAWVLTGNNLVILGERQPVSGAPFSTVIPAAGGAVKIDTGRRLDGGAEGAVLKDEYGTVVWRYPLGRGQIIKVVTPYLAANAYQDWVGNYELLARLVLDLDRPIWMDEYLHGYRDKETIAREVGKNIWDYLARTPLLLFFLQGGLILVIAIIAGNQRAGEPAVLETPETNNSEAYIEALAGVLQKARRSEFVIDRVGRAEKLKLGRRYNLDTASLSETELIDALEEAGKPTAELKKLLAERKDDLDDKRLGEWLRRWRDVSSEL